MKRALAVLLFALSAQMGLVAFADQTQNLFVISYFRPGDDDYTENDGVVITPENATARSGSPAVFHANPKPGEMVQYWIVADNAVDVDNDRGERFDYGSNTLTWPLNRAFSNQENLRVGARFCYITNSVAFNAGASGVSGSTAGTGWQCYTNSYALTPNGFSRTGYTFANWTNDAGVAYADGQVVSGSSFDDVTNNMQVVDLYAVWTPNVHEVSYSLDGGSYGSSHPSSATYDVPFEVSDPTRTGYTFSGWKVTGGLVTGTAKYGSDGESWSSVSSDSTLCKGANGSTWFKNLNPTNEASVTLTAQWAAKTTAVHFNNYNAQGGVSDTMIDYGAALNSVSPVPYWPDNSRRFLGYYTGEGGTGECYWNKDGQPVKATWDIDSATMTLYAHYVENVYYITYEPNGGVGDHFSVPFTNGTAITLSDGAAFSRQGSELLGWARLPTAVAPDYQLGEERVFIGETAYFSLYAIWKEYYYVAFDGNGATNETPMAVQKFAFGESKALSANEYGKVGYEFSGWATNGAAAAVQDISYANQQVVNNIAKSAGETNTLFASWRPISYVTAFDASKHSSVAIAPSNCIYDVEFPLPVIPYGDGELWKHVGWSNTLANVVYYTDEMTSVSNLCTTAGATNTLVAVWESMVGPLSEAMDIDNLVWGNVEEEDRAESWKVVHGVGYGTDSCVAQTGLQDGGKFWEMSTSVTNSGTLTFWWKTSGGSSSLNYYSTQGNKSSVVDTNYIGPTEWTKLSLHVEVLTGLGYTSDRKIYLCPASGNPSPAETIYIDRMTWTPDGSSVEPTEEDARDISGISFDGGVLSLSFTNADERFSYNLRGTNDLVAPLALWPVLWTTNGTGNITITPPVVPSAPQFFYYLETTAK